MNPNHHQFANLLAARRKAQGLTMEALASKVGVTKSNVHYWESGRGVPKASVLEPLAQALGVSYEDLFAVAGYPHPAGLPGPTAYLRAKYRALPDDALAEAEQFFADWQERHAQEGGGDAESDR